VPSREIKELKGLLRECLHILPYLRYCPALARSLVARVKNAIRPPGKRDDESWGVEWDGYEKPRLVELPPPERPVRRFWVEYRGEKITGALTREEAEAKLAELLGGAYLDPED
jgi:hypothetical protein